VLAWEKEGEVRSSRGIVMAEFFEDEEAEWGNPWHHLLAGSVAGTVEHCGMFPLDTVKVRRLR
jgi:hypothetical protein